VFAVLLAAALAAVGQTPAQAQDNGWNGPEAATETQTSPDCQVPVAVGFDAVEASGEQWFITEDCHGTVLVRGSRKLGWQNAARLPWALGEGSVGYSMLGALDGSSFYFLLLNNATRGLALWRVLSDGQVAEVRRLQTDGLTDAEAGWSLVVSGGKWWAMWKASPKRGAIADIREAHTFDGGDGVARTFITNQAPSGARYDEPTLLQATGMPLRLVLSRVAGSGPGLVTKRWDPSVRRWSGVAGVPYTSTGAATTTADAGYRVDRMWITSEVCQDATSVCNLYMQAYGPNGWKVVRLKGWLTLAQGPTRILGVMEDYTAGPQPQLTLMYPMPDDAPQEGTKFQTSAYNPLLALGDYDHGWTLYVSNSPDFLGTDLLWS
jgi:hypothetical protein